MDNLFQDMSEENFRKISVSFFVSCDLWTLGYIYLKFSDRSFLEKMIEVSAATKGVAVNSDHIEQIYQLASRAVVVMLAVILFFHLLNYFLYLKNKKAAFLYLNFYAWTAALITPFWAFSLIGGNVITVAGMFICGLMFLFNAVGLRYFPYEED